MENKNICVVLVTFNRKQLLLELLRSLCRQSVPISTIVIVDNCSSDGTSESLREEGIVDNVVQGQICESMWNNMKILYFLNESNTGGSGGFEKAFSIANELNSDYIWAMDDDIEPEEDCLEKLLAVMSDDVQVCVPSRNDDRWTDQLVKDYDLSNPFKLNLKQYKKIVDSRTIHEDTAEIVDMPLEGPLISAELCKKVGTPNSLFFIMYDDTDFAHRLGQYTTIKYVRDARLHRKLVQKQSQSSEWTWKEYYLLRNSFYFDKLYGKNILVRRVRPALSCAAKVGSAIARRKPFRARLVIRAYKDAISGRMGKQIEPGTDITKL